MAQFCWDSTNVHQLYMTRITRNAVEMVIAPLYGLGNTDKEQSLDRLATGMHMRSWLILEAGCVA